MIHPFKKGVVGYNYGDKTSYTPKHLGVDWNTWHEDLKAPCKLKVIKTIPQSQAPDGGNTLWFQPVGTSTMVRWLHLDKFYVKPGDIVEEGAVIVKSGNTGKSTGPHTHEDAWPKGIVTLNFADTMNPHDFYKDVDMNETKIVVSKDGQTLYKCTPIATDYPNFLKQAGVEGITVPNPIPPSSSL
jgi:hypothetical protein